MITMDLVMVMGLNSQKLDNKEERTIDIMLSVVLIVIGLLLSIKHYPPRNWIVYDGALYIDIARSLTEGITNFEYQGIYMLFRPPIYPYTLSIIYRLIEEPIPYILIARVVSSLFYALVSVTIFLAFKGYFGRLKALLASFFYLLNPLAFGMSIQPLVHSEFTFFYLLSMLLLLKWSESFRLIHIILFGIFAGISILTRYTGLTIVGIFFTYVYLLYLEGFISIEYRNNKAYYCGDCHYYISANPLDDHGKIFLHRYAEPIYRSIKGSKSCITRVY